MGTSHCQTSDPPLSQQPAFSVLLYSQQRSGPWVLKGETQKFLWGNWALAGGPALNPLPPLAKRAFIATFNQQPLVKLFYRTLLLLNLHIFYTTSNFAVGTASLSARVAYLYFHTTNKKESQEHCLPLLTSSSVILEESHWSQLRWHSSTNPCETCRELLPLTGSGAPLESLGSVPRMPKVFAAAEALMQRAGLTLQGPAPPWMSSHCSPGSCGKQHLPATEPQSSWNWFNFSFIVCKLQWLKKRLIRSTESPRKKSWKDFWTLGHGTVIENVQVSKGCHSTGWTFQHLLVMGQEAMALIYNETD